MIGETPPCFPRAPSLGEATQIYLNSWQSPSSLGLKINQVLSRHTEWGPQAPRARAGEAAGRTVSSEQAPLISMGPQPSCLKIASGTLLKMLTLQLTFGRSWQAIKPELKIGAAGRGRAPGSRDQAGRGRGQQDLGSRPWLGLCFQIQPSLAPPGIWLSARRTQVEGECRRQGRKREENGYGEN